jgi:cyclopropane-fatty-acyl-phospholipid synthase
MITTVLKHAYDEAFSVILKVVEQNVVPDPLVRAGIRSLLTQRAKESTPESGEAFQEKMQAFVEELKSMPVAVETDAANEQHYEVPTEYFNAVLGQKHFLPL